jgi:hypothetical protein
MDALAPTSVVDIGTGQGHWLAEFKRSGVPTVLGIDGDYVLETDGLLIPREAFVSHDLSTALPKLPTFQLALCLEVAEHLPYRRSRSLVQDLTRLAPAVLFSAAIPFQGGVGHINEQWPWFWQALFQEQGFVQLDPFRKLFWQNSEIGSFYQQNIYLYVDPQAVPEIYGRLKCNGGQDSLTLISYSSLYRATRGTRLQRALKKVVKTLRARF